MQPGKRLEAVLCLGTEEPNEIEWEELFSGTQVKCQKNTLSTKAFPNLVFQMHNIGGFEFSKLQILDLKSQDL